MNNKFFKYAYNYTKGLSAYKHKKYNKCILYFSEAIFHLPESHNAYLMRALSFFRLGDLDKAYEDILTADIYKKLNPDILFIKTFIEYKLSDFNSSLKSAKKGIKLFPEDYRFSYTAGLIMKKERRKKEALAFLSNSYELEKNSITALRLAGFYFQKEPKKAYCILESTAFQAMLLFEKAEIEKNINIKKRFYKILIFDKNYSDISLYRLSCLYIKEKDFGSAAALLAKLVKKYPQNTNLLILFIKCIYKEDKLDFAFNLINTAEKFCINSKLGDEYFFNISVLKFKIMVKLKTIERRDFEPLLRIAFSLKDKIGSDKYFLSLQKFYRMLYKRYGIKKDLVFANKIKNNEISDFEGFKLKTSGGKYKTWVFIIVLLLILIMLFIEIVSKN
jgi:hypothetical protein